LRCSERLLVFGFAFNPYDESVLSLFRTDGSNLKNILLIDPDPPRERAAAIWPNANITAAPPPSFTNSCPIQVRLPLQFDL